MRWFRSVWLLLVFHAATAFAIDPFVIKDIRVEGIQRTEAGTVFTRGLMWSGIAVVAFIDRHCWCEPALAAV